MVCRKCGAESSVNARFCPKCGSPVEQSESSVETAVGVVAQGTASESRNTGYPDMSKIWPEWQIEKQLGKGSYGVVYKAVRKDNNVESHAAIKVISIPADSSEIESIRSEGINFDGTKAYFKGIVDDFVNEIQLMETLKGVQNIVSVEDYKVIERTDDIGWEIYIRMELLTPFNTYIREKNLTEQEIIKLGTDMCTALEICGQRNVIHRDIKPENIFVNDFGHFKLGDFGIARKLENMTNGLSQKGTFNYMAPEVAAGSEYDSRVDIYSLGIVLYRLINNNKLPFLETDQQVLSPNERKSAIERRLRGEALPVPKGATPALANVVLCACSHNPKARFANATAMKNALLAVGSGQYAVPVATGCDATVSLVGNSGTDKTMNIANPVQKAEGTVSFAANEIRTSADSAVSSAPADMSGKKKKKSKEKMNKGKKAKVITIAVLAGILAIAIGLVVMFFTSSSYSVYRQMEDGKISSALREYNSDVEDNFIQEIILDILLKDRVGEVVEKYNQGEMEYDKAIEELEALEEMGYEGADVKIKEITVSNDADNALEMADKYYANGEYEKAITEYSKIPESDENYEEAQEKLAKVYAEYLALIEKNANEYKNQKKYTEAIKYIDATYGILSGNIDVSNLVAVREECLTAYKEIIASDVTEYISEEKYSQAFASIDEAIAFENDTYFHDLRATTETKYISVITDTVNTHLANEDYISAKRVTENALNVLPGNSDLEELKKEVEKKTPTYMLDVVSPYEDSCYSELINGETISMAGKSYTNGFVLSGNRYSDIYAIFNLDSRYTTLSYTVGHKDGSNMIPVVLKIYCDGVLKEEINLEADALPQKYTVDITGVNQLKFVMVSDDSYSVAYGFVNVTVK